MTRQLYCFSCCCLLLLWCQQVAVGFQCPKPPQQRTRTTKSALFYKVLGVPQEGDSKPPVIEEGSNNIKTGNLSNKSHVSEFFRKQRESMYGDGNNDSVQEPAYESAYYPPAPAPPAPAPPAPAPPAPAFASQVAEDPPSAAVDYNVNMVHVEEMRHWNGYVLELDTQRYESDGTINVAGTPWEASTVLADYMTNPDTGMAWEDMTVVELGSGIGTCSVAASLLGASVVATDASATSLQLIQHNSAKYQEFFKYPLRIEPLVWGDLNQAYEVCGGQYPNFILASDVIYQGSDRENLRATLEAICGPSTWIFLSHTWRDDPDFDQAFFDSLLDQFERFDVDVSMMPPGFQDVRPDGRTAVSVFLYRRR